MTSSLDLAPDPRSVRQARVWVVGELATIGRTDLADAAELGVSELVTNAILHADPPITVRIGGTQEHPRVEVRDTSVAPPSARDMSTHARLMATVGRGLGIVAMYSMTWGAEVSTRGKVIWFEPAVEPESPQARGTSRTGDMFDLSETVAEMVQAAGEPEARTTVRLLGMPVAAFAHYRTWYDEMRRELRILALTHGSDYPVASELSELMLRVEQERRQVGGVDQLDAALSAGRDRVDIAYHVPVSAPATMTRLRELLEELDEFCREQQMLTLVPSPRQVALRSWYLGEFERQARGEDPVPWPGDYTVEDTSP